MTKTINWDVTPKDALLINEIAARAVRLKYVSEPLNLMMTITACHANGNPLRLAELADSDDFNFAHDVLGIARAIDTDTGKLTGGFSPRFTVRDQFKW